MLAAVAGKLLLLNVIAAVVTVPTCNWNVPVMGRFGELKVSVWALDDAVTEFVNVVPCRPVFSSCHSSA